MRTSNPSNKSVARPGRHKGSNWATSSEQWGNRTLNIGDEATSHEAAWDLRWCSLDSWDDRAPHLLLDNTTLIERRKHLLLNGFKQIPPPPEAPSILIILEKTHNGALREQHWFNIHPHLPGKHERFVEVLNAALLNKLSSRIRTATKEALAENKENAGYNRSEAGRTQYGMALMEQWHGRLFGKQAANKRLAALMLKYQDIIRAIQAYDPLAPTTPAFSLEPLRGTWATSKRQAAYLKFLNAVILADEMLERSGAPSGTRSLTPKEQQLAEQMRKRGKGTERGSIRFIAEELQERGNRKKQSALIQDIKRHLRRKGLIRPK